MRTDNVPAAERHGHRLALDGGRLRVLHLPDRLQQALVEAEVGERGDRPGGERAGHLPGGTRGTGANVMIILCLFVREGVLGV